MIKYSDFEELHKHKGTDNYKILAIIPKQNEADSFQLDTVSNNIFINSYFEPKSKEKEGISYNTLKFDLFGNQKELFKAHSILKDGTMWNSDYFINWVINGDTTKHKYIDSLGDVDKKDPEKWLAKFKELYIKASYVYEFSWEYFFKIDNVWYMLPYNLDVINDNFVNNQFPAKEDQDVRMSKLVDITPDFYGKTNLQDDTFMKKVGYEVEDHERGKGLNPINFSAGYHYIELYMPLGDVIKIKRFGSMGVNIQTYKIPVSYGGRNDVVFIIQEPEEMYPNREFGGMYVIRPRDSEQPQRRYKKIVYKRNENGERIIDPKRSEESDEYKAWKVKKK